MLTKENIKNIYPLSPMQAGIYYYSLDNTLTFAYFVQVASRLQGNLELSNVEKTINELIERHDSLRTVFTRKKSDRLLQVVLKERKIDVHYEDISKKENRENYLLEFKERDKHNTFDLHKDMLLRAALFKLEDSEWEIVWSYHHIIMDGWSRGILISEFFEIYNSYVGNRGCQIPEAAQYRTHIQWLENQDKEESTNYWQKYLYGYEGASYVPVSFSFSTKGNNYEIGQLSCKIDRERVTGLIRLAADNRVTANVAMQTIWGILLGMYNRREDVVYGLVVSGRTSGIKGVESMVGLLINTIPIRIRYEEDTSFKQLLQTVQNSVVESEPYHWQPLVELQQKRQQNQDLINHVLAFENYPFDTILQQAERSRQEPVLKVKDRNKALLKLVNLELFEEGNYDLYLEIVPKEEFILRFHYNQNVYCSDFLRRIARHVDLILKQVIEDDELAIKELTILSAEEKNTILYEFNNTEIDYPANKTIQKLFEEQVEKTPAGIALIHNDEYLTYQELNIKANQLTDFLRQRINWSGGIVGIMMKFSIETIIGVLAVLKAGHAYLPINPVSPGNRVLSMLQDSNAAVLLTRSIHVKYHDLIELQGTGRLDFKVHLTSPRPQIEDFDSIPFPDRSLVNYEKYNRYIGLTLVKNYINIQGSRGCPFKCAYCHKIWPKTNIVRSAENIFSEVKRYYSLGVRRFAIVDDVFNFNAANSRRFFELIIENKLKIQIFFPNGVRGDILTKDYIDLMVRGGTTSIGVALETASPRLQKLVRKNLNLKRLRENIEYICETYPRVITELFTMHGLPTETEEEAGMTLDFVKTLRWIDFPTVNILKIYPNTDMEKIAFENGISRDAIRQSLKMAFHELPETLPFSKAFSKRYQTDFYEFFISRERVLNVLPKQMRLMTEDEIVQKYDSYLPVKISDFGDLLSFFKIKKSELEERECVDESVFSLPDLNKKFAKAFSPGVKPGKNALKILLLDLSQFFSSESDMLYDVVDAPLGLMYVLTYLNRQLKDKISGRIARSRIDFDNYYELRILLEEFKADILGIRTLSFYKEFFHRTVAMIRQWGIDVPIIVGGPYATSDYKDILMDNNIDLVVIGEGEITFSELIQKVIKNGGRLPDDSVLENIPGIAFRKKNTNIDLELTRPRHIFLLDDINEFLSRRSRKNAAKNGKPGDLAYINFTSGSTGNQKGVMVEHRSVVRLVKNSNYFDFGQEERILKTGAFEFDASTFEIWGAVLNGSSLCFVPGDVILSADMLRKAVRKYRVTTMWMTSPLFNHLSRIDEEIFAGIKNLLVGGDALSPVHINKVKRRLPYLRIINGYGPTENTTFSATHLIEKEYSENIPIGKPIANSTVYIMDRNYHLQPIEVTGELYTGGAGVARGYLNDVELTSEKFTGSSAAGGGRLYSTGDLAKWQQDGSILFQGRIDTQVKIRGYRVELSEIENQLVSLPGIKEAVVVAKEDRRGDKYLCAYIIAGPGEPGIVSRRTGGNSPEDRKSVRTRTAYMHPGVDERTGSDMTSMLHKFLSYTLPGYMIPSFFVQVKEIPLTPNGKIDRNSLPDPEIASTDEYIAPGNDIEKKMQEIWSEVLNIDKDSISVNSNFFELGGHSLRATILVARIHEELDVKLPLAEIFQTPRIRELSRYIEKSIKEKYASIKVSEKKEFYPVSSAEKRLYVLQQMDEKSVGYNIPAVFVMEGVINKLKLESIFNSLIQRHESLRTSFLQVKGEPVQKVHENLGIEIEYYESGSPDIFSQVGFVRPFDLSRVPLLRVGLFKEKDDRHILMLDIHHIVSDAASMDIIIRDFAALYDEKELRPLRIQYKDYSEWQNCDGYQKSIKDQETYWLNKFPGETPVLNLLTDYSRPAVYSFTGNTIKFNIEEDQSKALKGAARLHDVSMFMLLFAIYNIFLTKTAGQEEVIIGTPVIGRRHPDLGNIAGMFTNTLALRNNPIAEMTFIEFLNELKKNILEAFENQEYQFEDLVDRVKVSRDTGRNPLFDIMFVFRNSNISGLKLSELEFKPYDYQSRIAKFDLTLRVIEAEAEILFEFEYGTKLFNKRTIERFIKHFRKIMSSVIGNHDIHIARVEMLTGEEKRRVLHDFNSSSLGVKFPGNETLHELFEAQVEKTSAAIAVVQVNQNEFLSYRELNKRANRLANLLRRKGLKTNETAALMLERSVEMIIGILAVLKAGAGYLPLEPKIPSRRARSILTDCCTEILITGCTHSGRYLFPDPHEMRTAAESIYHFSMGIVILSEMEDILKEQQTRNPASFNRPSDLAYIIYTSGSTGMPKGVAVNHRNVVRLMFNEKNLFDFSNDDTWTMFHSYCFDFSVWEMYGAILYGGKLAVIPGDIVLDPARYLMVLRDFRVTVLNQTPSAFINLMSEELTQEKKQLYLRYVIFGGEALHPVKLKAWRLRYPLTRLINMYGITETTVHVTYKEIDEEDIELNRNNIGKPVPTLSSYILDEHLNPLSIGIAGELYVGGAGVSRGYLNRPGLSGDRFVSNPYQAENHLNNEQEELLYKSGDLVFMHENGELEYLGRRDQQVQLRGFRVEPGEIEYRLLQHQDIQNVVVIAREDKKGEKNLCAYIVSGKEIAVSELRDYLTANLPGYMVPDYFVHIREIPLTPNGKIDKKKLPEPELKAGKNISLPGNEIEERLVRIWSEVLEIERNVIGIDSNFFELGGNSLKIVKLKNDIGNLFEKDVRVIELFIYSTIRSLVDYFAKDKNKETIFDEGNRKEVLNRGKRKLIGKQRKVPPVS